MMKELLKIVSKKLFVISILLGSLYSISDYGESFIISRLVTSPLTVEKVTKLAICVLIVRLVMLITAKIDSYITAINNQKTQTSIQKYYFNKLRSMSNENSIYYNRNYILPLFQIQNRVKDEADVVGVLSEGKSYYASYVADKYFNGKKFYEVSREEFEKFIDLLHAQITPNNNSSAISHISEYKNAEINNLTEEEIKECSFEILDGITILWGKDIHLKAWTTLENVIKLAFEEEIRRIKSGQPIEVTRQKRDRIIARYPELFSSENESNMYINDYVNDFCFECEQSELEYESSTQNLLSSEKIRDVAREDGVPKKKSFAIDGIAELQEIYDRDVFANIQEQE